MALAPCLLEGAGHAHEEHMGRARSDLLDDARMILRAKIAVAEPSDCEARILSLATLHQRGDDLGTRPQKIDAQPVFPGGREEARHEVNTGHALRYRLARSPQRPHDRLAVGNV